MFVCLFGCVFVCFRVCMYVCMYVCAFLGFLCVYVCISPLTTTPCLISPFIIIPPLIIFQPPSRPQSYSQVLQHLPPKTTHPHYHFDHYSKPLRPPLKTTSTTTQRPPRATKTTTTSPPQRYTATLAVPSSSWYCCSTAARTSALFPAIPASFRNTPPTRYLFFFCHIPVF